MRRIASIIPALALMATFAAPAAAQYGERPSKNIVEVAAEAGTFTTLLAAAEAAGLVGVLTGEGPFTVFAPTDEAFAALPDGTIEALLANPEQLRAILTYHVVPGRVSSAQVVELTEAATVQGQNVTFSVYGETVRVNDARVVAVDIQASNGVIHVIDAVILPTAN